FQRERQRNMQKARAAEEARDRETDETSAAGGIRVNDRRRVVLDDDAAEGVRTREAAAEPQLKPKYVEELEARTRAAEEVATDVQARFEQVRAELRRETDAIRQRLARTADERVQREKAEFIASLLPVLDNLQRAIEAAASDGSIESLLDGLHGTASGFENALNVAGAEPFNALGETFDPELHEAVDTTEVEPARDNTITAEYSRGYTMGGQLLRPARVQVGRSDQ
ncbi:MAG: nucleotide exchange factor GrpE, partial [Acidobacteria bacterium]|nr:nucleotide exchange factor GrpE [Acidobacteriota bacterium]